MRDRRVKTNEKLTVQVVPNLVANSNRRIYTDIPVVDNVVVVDFCHWRRAVGMDLIAAIHDRREDVVVIGINLNVAQPWLDVVKLVLPGLVRHDGLDEDKLPNDLAFFLEHYNGRLRGRGWLNGGADAKSRSPDLGVGLGLAPAATACRPPAAVGVGRAAHAVVLESAAGGSLDGSLAV